MSHKKLPTLFKSSALLSLIPILSLQSVAQTSEPAGTAGKISRELWWNMSARTDLEYLWGQDAYYQTADVQSELSILEAPQGAGNQYGQRLRGYIVAPVTGEYRFWASGDDHFALWLGTGESKFSKQKLIHYQGYTSFREWGLHRKQASAAVMLEGGKRYYVEAQNKEGGGEDHLSVSWSYAGGAGLTNWARDAAAVASQSSEGWGGSPDKAIDGNTSGRYNDGSVTHTLGQSGNWWQVDLGADRLIDRVELFNRDEDGIVAKRLSNYRLSVLDSAGNVVISQDFHTAGSHVKANDFWETGGVQGRVLKIELIGPGASGEEYLSLAEVQVLGRSNAAAAYQSREVVPGTALESYAGSLNDLDNDELADDWEIQYGFDPTVAQGGLFSPHSDSDKDALSNLEESLLQLDPFVGSSVDGYLTAERWSGIHKYNVEELIDSDTFFGDPEMRQLVDVTSFTNIGAYSGARLRGYITAPVSGNYRFWVSARNGGQLWLSENSTKYSKKLLSQMGPALGTGHGVVSTSSNLWDNYSSQISEEVYLEAGEKYFVEMLTQQGHGGGYHVSAAWAVPGQARTALPLNVISSYGNEAEDSDDDYLPDAWETQYGLSITDNGAIDRQKEGENGDFDADGLSNRLEYLAGTDPTNRDSNNNGILDGDEHNNSGNSGSSPLDFPVGDLVSQFNMNAYNVVSGDWNPSSQGLLTNSLISSVEWSFDVPSSGNWLLRVETMMLQASLSNEKVPVKVFVDGELRYDSNVDFGSSSTSTINVLTQDLSTGSHVVRIDVNNILAHRSISIKDIELLKPAGDDLDNDNIPDWLEYNLAKRNYVEVYSPTSLISPAFFEGKSDQRDSVTLNSNTALAGMGTNHFYANLALDPLAATPFSIALGGGVSESGTITWESTNIHELETIELRKDDSLKLKATPLSGATNGAVTLTINKDTDFVLFEDFEGADYGAWTVEGDAFGSGPAVSSGVVHNWNTINGKSANSYISSGSSAGQVGKLTSPDFTISHDYIHFRISAGHYPLLTRMRLLDAVTGDELRSATGLNTTVARNDLWDVTALAGKLVKIEIEDNLASSYGWINCDHIAFSNVTESPVSTAPLSSGISTVASTPSEFVGYLPTSEASAVTVWTGKNINDVVSGTGTMNGGWIGSSVTASVYNFKVDGNNATFQLQILAGGNTKVVKVALTQTATEIKAHQIYAKYKAGNHLGTDFDTINASSAAAGSGGYGVTNLSFTFLNEVYQLSSDTETQVHQFTRSGSYIVTATSANETASLRVIVKQAEVSALTTDFISSSIGSLELNRYDVSYGTHYDGGQYLDYLTRSLTANNLNVVFNPLKVGESRVVIRTAANGPIISTQAVNIFDVAGAFRNNSVESALSSAWPGYYVVTSPVTAVGLPPGGSVKISIFRAGVTFLDGSKTKILTAADFVDGKYDAQFLFPENMHGGFCHTYSYYDRNGNQL